MTDNNSEPARGPDYPLADELILEDPAQYRALFEETRQQIVSLLLERAATTSELAEVLDKPKGTIGHHLKTLAEAGLVTVVRTKKVRALEAKYYGRTARLFLYGRVHEAIGEEQRLVSIASDGLRRAADNDNFRTANTRYARIPLERAIEWKHRLDELVVEFAAEPLGGDVTYALTFTLYGTDRPALRESDDADD